MSTEASDDTIRLRGLSQRYYDGYHSQLHRAECECASCTALQLSKAYLAEHPDDEDELLTGEWLGSTFNNCVWTIGTGAYLTALPSHVGVVGVWISSDNYGEYRSVDLPTIQTRGQLRRLLALLKPAT